ncbi:NEDD4 family-interacting protein 1-like [Anthonomus grandis grandis]|uniref:NEDD4 family-interacting protein 1-like n=1 Tax=Anthonomus grandis grandis TaxID=2921223 RepID=UPI002166304B|nr:NEDD4 family-interacting protein 1-like [Anthonomus grandis grandis]
MSGSAPHTPEMDRGKETSNSQLSSPIVQRPEGETAVHFSNEIDRTETTAMTSAGPRVPAPPPGPGVVEIDRIMNMSMPTSSSIEDIPPPKADYNAPPPYEVAAQPTKLPTYEEVQREKNLEEAELLGLSIVNVVDDPTVFRSPPNQRILLPIDNEAHEEADTSLLGTDFMFYIAFFVAFIFNWIGFLLLMCFCHTIASRYGALSGFGLSLAKWTFIVQHSTELASRDNSWLWWLIMTFGLIICIRAILQYLNIKRGWHMLSASHQERLLFFY